MDEHQLTKFDVPGAYGDLAWNDAYGQYRQPSSAVRLGWQARVLGGGGLINGALTMRPPSSDLEQLPESWRGALPAHFARLETELHLTATPSVDGVHYGSATRELLFDGLSRLLGTRTVPLNADPDSRTNTASLPTVTALGGVRQSTASVQLETALGVARDAARGAGGTQTSELRFELRLSSTVTGVEVRADGTATAVRYTDGSGDEHVASLRPGGRVVLTAGALATPRLLWLSGVVCTPEPDPPYWAHGPYARLATPRLDGPCA